MDHHSRYLTLEDLRARARARVPHFAFAYLDTATGSGAAARRNRAALDRVLFMPSVLHGEPQPEFATRFLGQEYSLPVGMAPVGQSGLLWPGAEAMLARHAARARLPYCLSNVANAAPEEIGPLAQGHGWFQLYPPRDEAIRLDMLRRVAESGFDTLVFTVDVPVAARREAQVRGGLVQPPRLTPRIAAQCLRTPVWSLKRARAGMPRMETLMKYADDDTPRDPTKHVGYLLRTAPDWSYLDWLRAHWQGKLILKGVLRPEDARRAEAAGVDALWVSNHGGRQFDGAPAAIACLPGVRAATALPLLVDSGIESGLDVLRAVALGADMVMLGRGWLYAVCALGEEGPAHLEELLRRDLIANLGQLGVSRAEMLRGREIFANSANLPE